MDLKTFSKITTVTLPNSNKVENEGANAQGELSATEFNNFVLAVAALLAGYNSRADDLNFNMGELTTRLNSKFDLQCMSEDAVDALTASDAVEYVLYAGLEDESAETSVSFENNTVTVEGDVTLSENTITVSGATYNNNTITI